MPPAFRLLPCSFAACADSLDVISVSCRDLKICVIEDTTFENRLFELFPERLIEPKGSWSTIVDGLSNGDCNAVAGGVSDISLTSIRTNGYVGRYQTGGNRYSKDPLAVVTRQVDGDDWFKFVYWVVSALFYAEEEGITSETWQQMPLPPFFGAELASMFQNAVREVGSYAEIYQRNAEAEASRGGLNTINPGMSGPQHYPLPGIA